ncbi:MAG: transcriptional regulator, partial [Anaeromyxobacteraceae bacterium]
SGGRAEAARERLERALAELPRGSGDDRAEVLHLGAQLAWHEGRARDALDLALACADEARRSGDDALAARGDDMAALSRASLREPAAGDEVARCERGAEAPFEVHLVLFENALLGDRPPQALEADVATYRERAARRDATTALAIACAVEGAIAARAARWDAADALLREAAERFRRAGSAFGEAFALDGLAASLTARGRAEEGLSVLGRALLAGERAAPRRHALLRLHATLARNRLAAGALYAAEDALREASALSARHGACAVCAALFLPELARVHLARGRVADAAACAADLEDIAARHGGRGLGAVACAARGRVLLAEGRTGEGRAVLLAAARLHDDGGARYEAARCTALAGSDEGALAALGAGEPL